MSKAQRLAATAKPAPLHFSIFDHQLRREVQAGILPHLNDTVGVGFFHGDDVRTCLEGISVEIFVVGVSELPKDNWHGVIDSCQQKQQKCGVIVRTHDRSKWRTLQAMHQKAPFAFIIAAGGPRSDLKQMFPLTPLATDITDIVMPGQQLAAFIERVIVSTRDERIATA